jgi:hypothetical protein
MNDNRKYKGCFFNKVTSLVLILSGSSDNDSRMSKIIASNIYMIIRVMEWSGIKEGDNGWGVIPLLSPGSDAYSVEVVLMSSMGRFQEICSIFRLPSALSSTLTNLSTRQCDSTISTSREGDGGPDWRYIGNLFRGSRCSSKNQGV